MNDKQNQLCLAFAAVSFVIAVVFMVVYGPSWILTFAGIILLLNAYVMGLRLKLADAHSAPPGPSDVPTEVQPPPTTNPTEKAVSETRNVLHYLIGDTRHREVMAHDLARVAEQCGHREFAAKLRAHFGPS